MQYRIDDISALGFGCMRLPRRGTSYDMKAAEQQILHAIECGVNYFDTAYTYPGNEKVLGTILHDNHCRDKVKIATKLPHYMITDRNQLDKFFSEQLKRLQTNHIDYYLMHMLPDANVWSQLKELGITEWIEQKKANGEIGKIGFSYHGGTDDFKELIDVYPWEFCQIQYNYMDEHSQAGRSGLEYAANKGLPVIIMEPLRGGKLAASLPQKASALINAKGDRSPAEWALRWLWDQPEVSVILSGMNSMEMLDENIRIASAAEPGQLTDDDLRFIADLKEAISEKIKTACTGCSYCMPCPQGVDIPGAFRCYNASYMDSYYTGLKEYVMCTTLRNKKSTASLCTGCGKCESRCPQKIPIRTELTKVKRRLEGTIYKIGTFFLKYRFKTDR